MPEEEGDPHFSQQNLFCLQAFLGGEGGEKGKKECLL